MANSNQPAWFSNLPDAPSATQKERAQEATIGGTQATTSRTEQLTPAQVRVANAQAAQAEKKISDAAAAERQGVVDTHEARQKSIGDTENLLRNIQQARDNIGFWSTGAPGQATKSLWGSPSSDLQSSLDSISSPLVLKAMVDARKGSKVGATGFGALSEKELDLLKSAIASTKQSQNKQQLLENLDRIEQSYRRFMAYNANMDPETPEGAHWAGLAAPTALGGPGTEITSEERNVEDPALRGVNSTLIGMIKAGRTPDQIRSWLDSVQPGLGAKVTGIEENVAAWKASGGRPAAWDIKSNVEEKLQPNTPVGKVLGAAINNPVGAGAVGYGDVLTGGYLDEMSGNQAGGAALMEGLRQKYPEPYFGGQLAGGVTQGLLGEGLLARYGLKASPLLMDAVQGGLYGSGSAEPGSRFEGGVTGAVLGAGTGAAIRGTGRAVGTMARGVQDTGADVLTDAGIPLTLGQITRGQPKSFEDKLTSLPIVGDQIKARRADAGREFNRAAFDETLAPIGGTTNGEIGQAGIALAQQASNDAYTSALDGVLLKPDTTFIRTVRGQPYQKLGQVPEHGPTLVSEIDKAISENLDANGLLTGKGFQIARQRIEDLKREYSDVRGYRSYVKPHLDTIERGLDDLFERQEPARFPQYLNANKTYRRLQILQSAVDTAPAEAGEVFTPAILRNKSRQYGIQFGGKAASARGDRPFNELTKAGTSIMAPGYPDSGTAGRLALPLVLGSLAGGGRYAQTNGEEGGDTGGSILTGLGAAALAATPYSRTGQRLLQNMILGNRSPTSKWLGDTLTKYSPHAARAFVPQAVDSALDRTPAPRVTYNPDPIISRARAAESLQPVDMSGLGSPIGAPSGGIMYDPNTRMYTNTVSGQSAQSPEELMGGE